MSINVSSVLIEKGWARERLNRTGGYYVGGPTRHAVHCTPWGRLIQGFVSKNFSRKLVYTPVGLLINIRN